MHLFEKISDQDLLQKTITLVKEERRVGIEVLKHLAEVERRSLHLREGYASLWEYCTQALGYSAGAAHRRISSMRLLVSVPEPEQRKIEESIGNGRLSLTALAQVQNFAKAKKREKGVRVSVAEKLALVTELEGKSSREAERILIARAPDSFTTKERVSAVSDAQTRMSLIVWNELIEKLDQLKAAHAHRLKKFTLEEVITLLADDALKAIEKKRVGTGEETPTRPIIAAKAMPPKIEATLVSGSAAGGTPQPRPAIPAQVKRQVWRRAQGCCEYQGSATGRRCGSIHALQIDHRVPIAASGIRGANSYRHPGAGSAELVDVNRPENLRVFCSHHNRVAWQEWRTEKKDLKRYFSEIDTAF